MEIITKNLISTLWNQPEKFTPLENHSCCTVRSLNIFNFLEKCYISSIVPSLIKVGEPTIFDINFNDTIPLSADVQVTLNGVVLPGKVISGTVVRFQQTLTDADQIYSFSVSFDKVQSILSGNVKIYTFGLK
jgi:hypothetical protein